MILKRKGVLIVLPPVFSDAIQFQTPDSLVTRPGCILPRTLLIFRYHLLIFHRTVCSFSPDSEGVFLVLGRSYFSDGGL